MDESHEVTQEQIVKLAEEVGRTPAGAEPAQGSTPVVDARKFTVSRLVDFLVLNRRNRGKGFILVNLPAGVSPGDLFGVPVVSDPFERYADVGLERPRRRKVREAEEDNEDEAEESEGPEWLKEDVEIDEEEWATRVRERILLPYTAPVGPFGRGPRGRKALAEPPALKTDWLDANVCLEHPAGLRFPLPKFAVDVPELPRYEKEPEEEVEVELPNNNTDSI